MLTKAQVVSITNAIESTYIGVCEVVYYENFQRNNGTTGFSEVTAFKNIPCRLSFESIKNTNEDMNVNIRSSSVKLFLSPDIVVKTGAKIIVNQNNREFVYKSSGEPAVYETHQELILKLFDKWS